MIAGSKIVKKMIVAIPAEINDGHNIAMILCITGIVCCIPQYYTKLRFWLVCLVRQAINICCKNVHLGFAQKLGVCRHTSCSSLGNTLLDAAGGTTI